MNERIRELANEVGISVEYLTNTKQIELLEKFAELVAAEEREACAEWLRDNYQDYENIADTCEAIRARGNHEALDRMVAENQRMGLYDDGPAVKTYCGGKPNYCTVQVTVQVITQEPVCFLTETAWDYEIANWGDPDGFPVYTVPPKREWVGLTDEEVFEFADTNLYEGGKNYGILSFGKAIEAKLKEKNT